MMFRGGIIVIQIPKSYNVRILRYTSKDVAFDHRGSWIVFRKMFIQYKKLTGSALLADRALGEKDKARPNVVHGKQNTSIKRLCQA